MYPTRQRQRAKEKAMKDLNWTYLDEQQKYIQDQIDKINNAATNQQSSLTWKIVNNVSGRRKSPKSKLKANTQEERLELWKNHFQGLLGKEPTVNDLPMTKIIHNEQDISVDDFTIEELEKVLKKNAKTEKLLALTISRLKYGRREISTTLFFNVVTQYFIKTKSKSGRKAVSYPSP